MYSFSMPDRKLIYEVHNALEIFRTLLQDNKSLCNRIDNSYEELLLNDLQTVPEQYDKDILNGLKIVKTIINNINFIKISEELGSLTGINMCLELNTFHIFESMIGKLEMSKKDRARIMNIVSKFRPLFECVDRLISNPVELVRKIGTMRNDMLNDLFWGEKRRGKNIFDAEMLMLM